MDEKLKIGIVAEGISDYWVLKHIIARFLKDQDPIIVPLQPLISVSGKQSGFGSWRNVFEYISKKEYIVELAQNEGCHYVVIQIDTDVCEEYDIKKCVDISELYESVQAKIKDTTHNEFDKDKLMYAICIHSLECWLIPFMTNEIKKCQKQDNCINTLNRQVKTMGTIDGKNKGDAKHLYDHILKQKKKVTDFAEIATHNHGFKKFIESLKLIHEG